MIKEGETTRAKLTNTCPIPNIMKQVLEITILVKIADLSETLPQLRVAITQGARIKGVSSKQEKKEKAQMRKETNTLFTIGMGRTPVVVEMEIMRCKLSNTIFDGGLGINILLERAWKALGKPTLWPPTFELAGANQHGIKPIGTLMG